MERIVKARNMLENKAISEKRIVRKFLGYDRTEYLRRKIGEAEDANHVWSVHLQPLRKLLHVGERPAFEKPCPFPCAGEQSYERPRFVKVDVVHLALPDNDEPPASADGLKADRNRY